MEAPQQNQDGQEGSQSHGSNIPFEVRYFDSDTYTKVFHTHINVFQLFFSFLSQKGIEVDPNELSGILNKYWETYVKTGNSLGPIPDGSTCQHVFTKGSLDKRGTMCGANAKHWGADGKPKCSSHKNAKASKAIPADGLPPSNKSGSVFAYKDHKNSGVTAAQNLTTLQSSIKEQITPPQINLTQNEFGIIYNTDTRLVFTQKEDGFYYAIGVLSEDSRSYNKLTSVETYLCYCNGWKWDKDCVEDSEISEHPLKGGLDPNNPLVSKQNDLIQSKIDRFNQNNS